MLEENKLMKNKFKKTYSGFTPSVKNRDASAGSALRASRFSTEGFTLVEVMISIGLFTIVMVIGIGAILGVNSTHRKTQTMRSVVDNLSFVMEDMARSLRLADSIFCSQNSVAPNSALDISSGGQTAVSCPNGGNIIAFEPYWNYDLNTPDNQVIYYINDANGIGTIFKKSAENMDWTSDDLFIPITPAEIDIDISKSGFWVTGAEDETPALQPKVTIVLVGTVRLGNASTEFNLQTTVSQRLLDKTP